MKSMVSRLKSSLTSTTDIATKVSNALFEKATQGNVTAMIYYLKIRDREN
jgi:hypothetical protein